ncbi:HU family DNA-binding protein [Gluconobacter morbifer]|uniref:DNA-binding protein HU-beta n=1 Tax=Gluconobacter morbifer G707 TaxID=1088869 RepID=G6XKL0_9PROT|nr:HU family DNA-binding protein [Gluconobacter morbifer]EHH67806.1 DNA-binding protein HU-beta [Gluconobacter morbifer G707]
MSKAFLAAVLQDSIQCTGVVAQRAANDLLDAIIEELRQEGRFTLPSFGTFTVCETGARQAVNPRTGAPVEVPAKRTVRFKASPGLKQTLDKEE